MSAAFILTVKSSNEKTGAMPVSTSPKSTCPTACPLLGACYADQSYLGAIWRRMSAVEAGTAIPNGRAQLQTINFDQLLEKVAGFEDGTVWRHNQAGDLPGNGDAIDATELGRLVAANAAANARGFTYTHKPMTHANAQAVRDANDAGFTVNLSANGFAHADELKATGAGPVVTLMSSATPKKHAVYRTPAGHKVIPCPKHHDPEMNCVKCELCTIAKRDVIVGFPGHSAGKRHVDAITRDGIAA